MIEQTRTSAIENWNSLNENFIVVQQLEQGVILRIL